MKKSSLVWRVVPFALAYVRTCSFHSNKIASFKRAYNELRHVCWSTWSEPQDLEIGSGTVFLFQQTFWSGHPEKCLILSHEVNAYGIKDSHRSSILGFENKMTGRGCVHVMSCVHFMRCAFGARRSGASVGQGIVFVSAIWSGQHDKYLLLLHEITTYWIKASITGLIRFWKQDDQCFLFQK